MHRFKFDDVSFPLVVVRAPKALEDEAFFDLFRRFEECFERRQRYVILLDTTPLTQIPDARQRALITDWQKQNVARSKRWNLGTAVVVTSALVRGALTALSWVVPEETPRVHVSTYEAALEWCCARLVADGTTLPLRVERLRRAP